MNGFFQRLNKLRCVTAFWWFACCGSFCVGFTVRFLCCGWLCLWGCFTWNMVVCLGWLLWFCGLGSRCLNGWMSGLVMFEDGWCFTWNVGLVGIQCGSGFTWNRNPRNHYFIHGDISVFHVKRVWGCAWCWRMRGWFLITSLLPYRLLWGLEFLVAWCFTWNYSTNG